MAEPAGVTLDRATWLALVAAIGADPRAAPLLAALEAERLAAEYTDAERAAKAAASLGFGWLCGADAIGWYPRHPGRHSRATADGGTEEVDPPRRLLGPGRDGRPVEAIDTDPVPAEGVHGLLRRGVIRELEPLGAGLFGAMAVAEPAPAPWRLGETGEPGPLCGAWLVDGAGARIAWLPRQVDATRILRDAAAARAAEADTYRLGALRDSLDRLRQVVLPERSYQPDPQLARLHEAACRAVDHLLAALPDWALPPGQRPAPPAAGGAPTPPPAAAAPTPPAADVTPALPPSAASAPPPDAATAPPGPARTGGGRGWLVALPAGLVLGWALRGLVGW